MKCAELGHAAPQTEWYKRTRMEKEGMLWIFGGFRNIAQAFRLFFQFLVRFTIQFCRNRKFLCGFLLFTQGLVGPRQFIMDRSIAIVDHSDLEVFPRFLKVA